jgi:NAD(P)H-dependent flavin oxidoreductase YrpB (nitropropane dioxygenase family)
MAAASLKETITTPLTKLFGIKHPIILAGMNVAAGPELAAAVTNAGGLGVIGGVGYTPEFLKEQIDHLKSFLIDKNAPFGIDLLLPQVGGSARATNKDYTDGKLPELIDVVISSGAKLFVSAVGVPSKAIVDKLHAAGIPVMNMVGAPKHVKKALAVGVDLICAQGGEGGGHTGDVASSILIPAVVDICKGKTSSLTGQPIYVVAAGGIFDGRGLAAALAWGAQAAWVGTRFVCAKEAGAPPRHQQAIIGAGFHDTVRTTIFTGRPMRVIKNEYINNWEAERQKEMKDLQAKGIIPYTKDVEERQAKGGEITPEEVKMMMENRPLLMGQCAGAIKDIKPAAQIINEMITDAISSLRASTALITPIRSRM